MFVFYHNGLAFPIQLDSLYALLLPQWMRHTYFIKCSIVPAGRAGRIFIETAHIGIQVVGTT